MNEITLTAQDCVAINPDLLREELEAALGVAVQLTARHEGGVLIEAHIRRADGLPFSGDDPAVVYTVAADHDPAGLSTGQAAELDRQLARDEALARLVTTDTDALRQDVAGAADVVALRGAALALADALADLVTLSRL